MKTGRLYPDDIPNSVFSQAKVLYQDKGMTLEDIFDEIDSKLPVYAKLSASIKTRIREESYRW